MIKIFHAKKPNFGLSIHENYFPEDFELVAEVDTNDLEEAYFLTNHVNNPWWENEGVKVIGEKNKRSSSVGDIFAKGNKLHQIANMGFEETECSNCHGLGTLPVCGYCEENVLHGSCDDSWDRECICQKILGV